MEENNNKRANLRNVRRKLFSDDGDDDDDDDGDAGRNNKESRERNNIGTFAEELQNQRANARERWNFDFEREQPLPGRYEWVRVRCDRNGIADSTRTSNEVRDSREGQQPRGTESDAADANGSSESDDRAERRESAR